MKPQARPTKSRVSMVVSDYLEYARANHGKTQTSISEELGLLSDGRPTNFLSLVKNGRCKLPVDKVEPLIKACGISDGSELVEAIIDEYYGPIIGLLKKYKRVSYSKAESAVIGAVIDAKVEADRELRQKELDAAQTRSDEQRAQNVSRPWKFDNKKLADFKQYIKDNLIN